MKITRKNKKGNLEKVIMERLKARLDHYEDLTKELLCPVHSEPPTFIAEDSKITFKACCETHYNSIHSFIESKKTEG
jgi:hypothetical protein